MIYLLLSIACSSLIMIIFKLLARKQIDVIYTIIVNYFIAGSLGWILAADQWNILVLSIQDWWPFALSIGCVFISLFQLMARSVRENGIALTTVSTKLSLLIPVSLAYVLYSQSLNSIQILGVLLGMFAVWFIAKAKLGVQLNLVFLLVIFLGSGALDALLNHTVQRLVQEEAKLLFTSILFSVAAFLGLILAPIYHMKTKRKMEIRNLYMGLALGIPNFGSIYFLLRALSSDLSSIVIFPINNVSIVLLSSLIGLVFYKEQLSKWQFVGIGIAILSITLISSYG